MVDEGWPSITRRPPLALVAYAILDHELVGVPLISRLVTTLGRCSPDTDGVHVSLGLSSTTSVWMIGWKSLALCFGDKDEEVLTCVHSKTSDRGSDVQPSASTSLSELSEVMLWVAGDTDGGACVFCYSSYLSALQPYRYTSHNSL